MAMTALFGGFPPAFYQSYYYNSEIMSDWQERMPLYNLYPLLNHLLLFAGSHLRDITEICRRFA
ncbi:MAG: fructosamine kinase family protein [Pseudomonadota bacterium]|nr:fructosamine kinase family protein [Pseudomonadota bacterium]